MFHIPPLGAAKYSPFQSLAESRLLIHKDESSRVKAETQSESQSQKEKKYHVPIPDFKVMHAAQEAKLALLKENIHPTLPQPIKLETDRRVIERQKFDDMVKEKQREQGRIMEEKRKPCRIVAEISFMSCLDSMLVVPCQNQRRCSLNYSWEYSWPLGCS